MFRLEGQPSCKSKKSPISPESQKWQVSGDVVKVGCAVEKRAWQQVEESLDVVKLARELANVRFLIGALFNSKQRELLPTLAQLAQDESIDLNLRFKNNLLSIEQFKHQNINHQKTSIVDLLSNIQNTDLVVDIRLIKDISHSADHLQNLALDVRLSHLLASVAHIASPSPSMPDPDTSN